MGTIFPREEKAEQIFDEILKNPRACDRLNEVLFLLQFHLQKKAKVPEPTFRELFLQQPYLMHTKTKIYQHL